MWITGGFNRALDSLMSTTIVTTNGSASDANLTVHFYEHCMVQYKANSVLIIGGAQNGIEKSSKTWIVDVKNRSNLIEGPSTTVAEGLYRAKSKCNEKVSKSKAKHEN